MTLLGSIVVPAAPPSEMKANSPSTANNSCQLYLVEDKTRICVATSNSTLPMDCAFELAQVLFRHIRPKRVVVLDTITTDKPEAELNELSSLCIIESTSSLQVKWDEKKYSALAPPYIVQGTAAAILGHCEVHGMVARLYVAFEDMHRTLKTCISFEQVLSSSILDLLPKKEMEASLETKRLRYMDTASRIGFQPRGKKVQGSSLLTELAPPPDGLFM
eukprot:CAMPEP_0167773630 /NCGR_PEP_ID=MMETSP0111_2-20121227/1537_1 /TAXON_ID=91324 /ORGANISM="Lotharella globosa, Strain CCCM811" /LENGTH=217 /DNA_ID=CAMNT_0007663309 /DNA_START=149 /DNA_END=802 /DNA_ORIENTATION=-